VLYRPSVLYYVFIYRLCFTQPYVLNFNLEHFNLCCRSLFLLNFIHSFIHRPNTTKSEPTQTDSVFTGFGGFNTITYNDHTRHLAGSMTDNGNTSPNDIHLSHLQIAGGSESVLHHYQSFDIEFSGPEYFRRVKISTLNTENP
jgi:hypothetical protein